MLFLSLSFYLIPLPSDTSKCESLLCVMRKTETQKVSNFICNIAHRDNRDCVLYIELGRMHSEGDEIGSFYLLTIKYLSIVLFIADCTANKFTWFLLTPNSNLSFSYQRLCIFCFHLWMQLKIEYSWNFHYEHYKFTCVILLDDAYDVLWLYIFC